MNTIKAAFKNHSGISSILIISAVVAALGIGGGGYYVATQNSNKQLQQSQNITSQAQTNQNESEVSIFGQEKYIQNENENNNQNQQMPTVPTQQQTPGQTVTIDEPLNITPNPTSKPTSQPTPFPTTNPITQPLPNPTIITPTPVPTPTFDQLFAACAKGTITIENATDTAIYEIVTKQGNNCNVNIKYLRHENNNWVNKKMTCSLNISNNFNSAIQKALQNIVSGKLKCNGELYNEMIKFFF